MTKPDQPHHRDRYMEAVEKIRAEKCTCYYDRRGVCFNPCKRCWALRQLEKVS